MDKASLERMQFDRRLVQRRGWISSTDLERELAALPDVSDKIATEPAPESAVETDAAAVPETSLAPGAEAPAEPGEA